jgi:hypothetical protein
VPQHVGMNEEFEFRSHSRPGHHALTSCELNGGLWRGLCTKFEAGFSRGHLPARSEWNPFAALQRYAGCRVKTGIVWRKLEMIVVLDRHPGRSPISSQRKAIDTGAPYGRTAR